MPDYTTPCVLPQQYTFNLGAAVAGTAAVPAGPPINFTGSHGTNSFVIGSTNVSPSNLSVGMSITGPGIQTGTFIDQISTDGSGFAIVEIDLPTTSTSSGGAFEAFTPSVAAIPAIPERPVLSKTAGWIEVIGNDSTSSFDCSPRYANTTLTGWISDHPVALYNFLNAVLGYHYVDATGALRRNNPIRHPRNQNLYAIKVTNSRGQVFGKQIVDGTLLVETADSPRYDSTSGLGAILKNSDQTDFTRWARYGRMMVTIEFAPPKYAMIPDTEEVNEWERYVDFDVTPNFYNVTIQTGNFLYAEGPNAKNQASLGEINYLEVKTTYSLRWRYIPEGFIGDTINYGLPYYTKIRACAGRVNNAVFMGFPKGTLLILEPQIDRYVCTTLLHNDLSLHQPIYYCDVTLPIVHFDPPNSSGDPPTTGERGHNLKPWWATGTSTVQYYLITNDGKSSGRRIYGDFDYSKIFTHWAS